MNKAELAAAVAEQVHGTETEARAHIDALFDVIMARVAAGGRVQVVGFGTFDGAHRAARVGRNPRTGAAIQIAPSVTPRFQAGQTFRTQVAEGASSGADAAAAVEQVVSAEAPKAAKKGAAKKGAAKKDVAKKGAAKKDAAKKEVAEKATVKKATAKKAKAAVEKKPGKSAQGAAKTGTSKTTAKKTAKPGKTAKATKASKTAKSGKSGKSAKK